MDTKRILKTVKIQVIQPHHFHHLHHSGVAKKPKVCNQYAEIYTGIRLTDEPHDQSQQHVH